MKLSNNTIKILKNFSTINQSLLIRQGNELSTLAIAKNIYAEATIEEEFPVEFAIYNLNEFLAAISLFQDPDLVFDERFVFIKESSSKKGGIRYFYANKDLIVYPTKKIRIPEEHIEFVLNEDDLEKIQKASSVLNVSDLIVSGDENGITISVTDKKNDSSNSFEILISEEAQSEPFKFFLKQENLKMIPGDYVVKISPKGISTFRKNDNSVFYAIALEAE